MGRTQLDGVGLEAGLEATEFIEVLDFLGPGTLPAKAFSEGIGI